MRSEVVEGANVKESRPTAAAQVVATVEKTIGAKR